MMTFGNLAPAWPRRLRAHWPALLLPLAATEVTLLVRSHQLASWAMPWLVVLLTLTVSVTALAPAVAARIAPFALFGYGCLGFPVAHWLLTWQTPGLFYGIVYAQPGSGSLYAVLPEACLFLAAAAWLLVVTGGPGSTALRRAVHQLRGAGGQPRTVPALLLLPVIGLGQEAYASLLWFRGAPGALTAVIIAAAAVALVVARPRLAAVTAVLGLAGLGCVLVISATNGSAEFIYWAVSGPDWSIPGFQWAAPGAFSGLYGPVVLLSPAAVWLTRAEGVALISAGCVLAPRLLAWVADADLARRAAALAQRVDRLDRTRSDATSTAAAELRRIERDLHDGAQARLVAVGMSLRAAEHLMTSSPDAALALVTEARETSSRALDDLRGLVRGIYPPVLADRGLADAVRALALDAPLAVDTDITLAGEPPMPVAAAVYFGIAEALTNAVRHSGAETIRIGIGYTGTLRATVTDDGAGGADLSLGTGLAGVERRLATFDGVLAVISPPGGPTIIAIEIPCQLSGHDPAPSWWPARLAVTRTSGG